MLPGYTIVESPKCYTPYTVIESLEGHKIFRSENSTFYIK